MPSNIFPFASVCPICPSDCSIVVLLNFLFLEIYLYFCLAIFILPLPFLSEIHVDIIPLLFKICLLDTILNSAWLRMAEGKEWVGHHHQHCTCNKDTNIYFQNASFRTKSWFFFCFENQRCHCFCSFVTNWSLCALYNHYVYQMGGWYWQHFKLRPIPFSINFQHTLQGFSPCLKRRLIIAKKQTCIVATFNLIDFPKIVFYAHGIWSDVLINFF